MLSKAYNESGDTEESASVEVGGAIAGGAKHANDGGIRTCRTRLNADVVVDILRFSSPHTIDACCLSSGQLNSIVTSLKSARPLRSIDFVHIAEQLTGRWLMAAQNMSIKLRCHAKDPHRSTGKGLRDFALSEMRFALSNCHVRRLRIDDPQGESIEEFAGFTEEDHCLVEELEINLIDAVCFMDEADYETVWRAIASLSPSRVHCAFNEGARRYKGLVTPGFTNARHVIVEGPLRATDRILRYITTGRRGSLCWLSNEESTADGCYFLEALVEMFQAQTEVGSFEHPLFLQFPIRWYSEAWCLQNPLGLAPIEGHFDSRNIARFYPDTTTTFDQHIMRVTGDYRAFVLENAGGQRIFVVASDESQSMADGNYSLQRVAFVPDLSILQD